MIKIQNLEKKFGTHLVLNKITLNLEPGFVYGIVGQNGAGKTTLFNCIAGLETFEGNIENSFATPLKYQLGYLQTDPYFMEYCTGKEYIQLLCNARGIATLDFKSCNLFQLPLDEYAVTYSTGMKKKLALTAILAQQNQIFIFDEPFNGIDLEGNMLLMGIIQKLKSLGKTILLASHIFSTIKETCDVILLLENGTIAGNYSKEAFDEVKNQLQAALFEKEASVFDFIQ